MSAYFLRKSFRTAASVGRVAARGSDLHMLACGFQISSVHSLTMQQALVQLAFKWVAHQHIRKQSLSTSENKQEEAPAASSADAAAEGEASTEESAGVVSDSEVIASLEKEIHELKEKVLRSLAEEENVRRIARKDVENARAYANSSFAKAMLEVADDLERAMAVVTPEQRADGNIDPTLKVLIEGIDMTDKNLHKIFHKFGVVQYGKVDEAFDPNIHDALFQIPDPSKPENTIGQVVKTGYMLKDRVLRAAQVGAYTKPEQTP